MAPGLRSVLEHFDPATLVGVTASPDRFDLKPGVEVFGNHEAGLLILSGEAADGPPAGTVPFIIYSVAGRKPLVRLGCGCEFLDHDLARALTQGAMIWP